MGHAQKKIFFFFSEIKLDYRPKFSKPFYFRGDSKFEMGDGKRPLDVTKEGVKGLDVKKLNIIQNTISLFPICYHFQILNNTQT